MADPLAVPLSRLFVVCGRAVEEETLRAAFSEYGSVQHVKVIKDKGVAYVKFDKASSAALAMEALNGAVLNNGRGPKLKVLLAEEPTQRGAPPPAPRIPDEVLSSDPDNIPPRSRLFVVVPKAAEAQVIQDEVSRLGEGLEYVKTDLIASKGVVFAKYSRASAALRVLEEVGSKGMLGPYKVKIMLAEPKTKRSASAAAALGAAAAAAAAGLPAATAAAGLRALEGLGLGAHMGLQHAALLAQQGKVPDLFGPGGVSALDQAAAYRHLAAVAASGALGPGAHHTAAAAAVAAAAVAAAASTNPLAAAQHAQLLSAGDMALHSLASGALGLGPEALGGEPVGGPLGFGHGGGHSAAGPSGSAFGAPFGGPLTGTDSSSGGGSGAAGQGSSTQRGAFGGSGSAAAAAELGAAHPGTGPHCGGGGPLAHHSSPGNASSMGSGSSSLSSYPPPPYPVRSLSPAASVSAAAATGHGGGGGGGANGALPPPLSATRLFVVCSKALDDALLTRLFRAYPGMEYCDLKRDRATGRSKGYAYVNYAAPASAAAAAHELNGIEFPPGSGCRLKVMPAEILAAAGGAGGQGAAAAAMGGGVDLAAPAGGGGGGGTAGHLGSGPLTAHNPGAPSTPLGGGGSAGGGGLAGLGGSAGSLRGSTSSLYGVTAGRPPPSPGLCSTGRAPGPASSAAPSPVGTPLDRGLPSDLAAVADGLGALSVGRTGSSLGPIGTPAGGGAGAGHVPSAVSSTVARELMFNVA